MKIGRSKWLIFTLILALVILAGAWWLHLFPYGTGSLLPVDPKLSMPTDPLPIEPAGEIVDGIHTKTGFKAGDGLEVVIANCTACHSSKLVIQNRATREGWESMIAWMQETQNLWPLGPNQELILNYLAENYAPTEQGRRDNLKDIQWYRLEE